MKRFMIMSLVMISLSMAVVHADAALPVGGWEKVLDSPASLTGTATNDEEVYALLRHKGLLYIGYYTAGLPNSRRSARLYTFDGQTQTLKYTFGTGLGFSSVQALGEYRGNIYAAMAGLDKGDGDIYVSTDGGTAWTKSYNALSDQFCSSLVTFKDKLYAGMGYSVGRILSFDGSTWQVAYPGKLSSGLVEWMLVYRGRLYAAFGGPFPGSAYIISTSDGVNWVADYDDALASGVYLEAASLVEFRGKLYAGMLRGGVVGGDLLVRDDATGRWSVAWNNPNGNRLHSLAVYNGRLYAGNANMSGAGDVYVSDDAVNFTKDLDTGLREIFRLHPYNGSLYMGSGYKIGEAEIWRKTDQFALRLSLRKLLEDQSSYTRNYIISTLSGLEDASAVKGRLLTNQGEIAQAFKPYYGEQAGNQLAALLTDGVLIAYKVILAQKTNNVATLANLQNKWKANADAIALLLSGLNDHWSKEDLRDALYKHLDFTTGEIISRLGKDWAADIGFYGKDSNAMLELADMLADGIVNQFPDKFKN